MLPGWYEQDENGIRFLSEPEKYKSHILKFILCRVLYVTYPSSTSVVVLFIYYILLPLGKVVLTTFNIVSGSKSGFARYLKCLKI